MMNKSISKARRFIINFQKTEPNDLWFQKDRIEFLQQMGEDKLFGFKERKILNDKFDDGCVMKVF